MEICPKAESGEIERSRRGPDHNRSRRDCGQDFGPCLASKQGPYKSMTYESYRKILLTIASPADRVETACFPAQISAVRTPSSIACATAFSTIFASSFKPSE